MDNATLDYIFRVIGRIGFLAILFASYLIGKYPTIKRTRYEFFIVALLLSVLSIVITTLDFFYPSPVVTIVSLIFNVTSTWILVAFLFGKLYTIRRVDVNTRLKMYQEEMAQKIRQLKK